MALELPTYPSSLTTTTQLTWIMAALGVIAAELNRIGEIVDAGGMTGPDGASIAESLENIARNTSGMSQDTERIAWGPDGTTRPIPPVTP